MQTSARLCARLVLALLLALPFLTVPVLTASASASGLPAPAPGLPPPAEGRFVSASAAVLPPSAEGRFVSKEGGFSLTPPERWRGVDPAAFAVPGTLRAGWSPDDRTSILVFTTRLAEPVTPSFLLSQHQAAAKRTPGAAVREERTFELAGMRAMSFAFTAPGTGGAVDGRGHEPTAQHWVAVPHQRDVLFLLLTCPVSGFDSSDAAFRSLLSTLQVSGAQTDQQSVPR